MTITELESPFAKRRKHRISREQEKITPQEAINLTKMALAEPEPDYDLVEDEMDRDETTPENRASNGFNRLPYSRQNTKLDYVANLPAHRLRETIRAYADRNYLATRNPYDLFPRLVAVPLIERFQSSNAMVTDQVMYKEVQMRNNVRHRPVSGNHYRQSLGEQRQSYLSHHILSSQSSNFQAGLARQRRDTRMVRDNELERAFSRRMFHLNYV